MYTIESIVAEATANKIKRESKPIRTAIADTVGVISGVATTINYMVGIINANLEVEYYSSKIEGLKELEALLAK